MDPDDPPADPRVQFTDILDRMQLLSEDFTSHADDHELILALARAPEGDHGPADDVVSDDYCADLHLPPGATYRAAARKLAENLGLRPDPDAG